MSSPSSPFDVSMITRDPQLNMWCELAVATIFVEPGIAFGSVVV